MERHSHTVSNKLVKKTATKKAIFFDEGKRWKKIKHFFPIPVVFITFFAFAILYAYVYAPYSHTISAARAREIDDVVETINNETKPVVNKGTFMRINSIYGEDYIERFGEEKKVVILTFDDGPDPRFTPQILKILKEQRVNGTFFITGQQLYKHPETAKLIHKMGFDLGLHTFSHYENKQDTRLSWWTFIKELDFTEKLFIHILGYKTTIFRVPFLGLEDKLSYNSLMYIREAAKRGLTISAPTVDAEDWLWVDPKQKNKKSTTSDVQTVVILFHDAGGNRKPTIEALPQVIQFYKDRGYEFSTVSEYAKTQNLSAQEPLGIQDRVLSSAVFWLYHSYKQIPGALNNGFFLGLFIVIIHMLIFIVLALLHPFIQKRRHRNALNRRVNKIKNPLVSVIIPMHNEESSIRETLQAILKSSFSNLEILVVDDGSTDNSAVEVKKVKDKRVQLLSNEDRGKYKALNYAFSKAKGRYTVCIDADTRINTGAIKKIVSLFNDTSIAAVAGNVRVGNKNNLVTKLQSVEYALNHGIEKRAWDTFGLVLVVPGAFGAWRTVVVKKLGGFSGDTLAEDFDLTMRILKEGYKVGYCDQAIAYTEGPTTFRQLFTQRFRWNYGNLQVYFKNKNLLLKRKFGVFGLFLLPRALFIQYPSLLLNPFVDIFIIVNLFFGQKDLTFIFFGLYLFAQLFNALIAFKLTNHTLRDLLYVPLMRLPYTQFMYIVFYVVLFQALKGEFIAWSKLTHSGKFTTSV